MSSLSLPTFTIITLTILFFISPTLIPSINAYNLRDTSGRKVINGGRYYISSKTPRPYNYATITWAYNSSISTIKNCPLYTTLNYNVNNSVAIVSSSMTLSKYIPVGISVDITFVDNTTACNIPLSWSAMPSVNSIVNDFYVVVGYELPSYDAGAFKIVDSGLSLKNVYKFMYCTEDEGCMDVGWLAKSRDSYLAMTMDPKVELEPFHFVFVKS